MEECMRFLGLKSLPQREVVSSFIERKVRWLSMEEGPTIGTDSTLGLF